MSRCTHQWSWAPSLVNFQNIKFHFEQCFVYRSRLSNINSPTWYTVHIYIECNTPAIVMLLRPISSCFNLKQRRRAFPTTVVSNSSCETWLYRWRSFSLCERFWIFNKKVLQSLSILKIIFKVRFGFILIFLILILIHFLLYWDKKPCLREPNHCWLNPKVSYQSLFQTVFILG